MIAETETNLSNADFDRLCEVVHRHCGINLHDGKQSLVRARLAKRLRAAGFDSPTAYLDRVLGGADDREFTLLIDALSTNLTSFYREPDHFRHLATTALPALLARKTAGGDTRLRLWCAGCSTGEEPYTLAMTLLDTVPDAGRLDIKMLATDISTHVLRIAQRACYEEQRFESLPPSYKGRFFRPTVVDGERRFSVAAEVQRLIAFRHLNLMDAWPFNGPFDFVFCRNVMIYFDKPTQERLVNRFAEVLAPRGLLFTGHSESLTGIQHPFQYVRPSVYGKN